MKQVVISLCVCVCFKKQFIDTENKYYGAGTPILNDTRWREARIVSLQCDCRIQLPKGQKTIFKCEIT